MRLPTTEQAPLRGAENRHGVPCTTAATTVSPPVAPAYRRSQPDRERIADLLAGIAADDTGAFAALYDALVPHVWALTSMLAGDHELAQAATQLAFESLWKAAASGPPDPESATAWAMAIAVRSGSETANDHQRRRDQHTSDHDRDLPEPSACSDSGRQGSCQPIHQLLLMLPAEQRDAILLARCGRLTVGEVAQALQTSPGMTANLLRDGLVRLRNLLAAGAVG